MSEFSQIKDKVSGYYTAKLEAHGPIHSGVDWNSKESQELRFSRLMSVCDTSASFSVNDLGCGYGALFDYLKERGHDFSYFGYDLSEKMINAAREIHGESDRCRWHTGARNIPPADYTLASGLLNVRIDVPDSEWREYCLDILRHMNAGSRKGFAFNALSAYADRRRPDLYYSDPGFFFDYCMKNFSRSVALLHDYGLYEFTILVRK